MIGDGKEHVCSGCYEIIATHDPEAYQSGAFYYHSNGHEEMHASRSRGGFVRAKIHPLEETLLEGTTGS
jgi:hypothetical protein